ncbi:N-succinyl-L,L-diaminopimelate desuccinylase [Rubellimicrobium mesophilum DSM 19309]|uniref:Succinyl-diaminopimelate desuccinylase n=1 Tax=Rubellimicrobium mesophilum DSM 19309 TaxID=442562 RepID=A0A017HMW4_9RHOB|nr:succinyl-diaminopimelate desuccinylase [Rubellimicrobium mesophilum]EYD75716.1 N-succinyl-L,L-diaminopimelate desuccinylase [Rubellimicrobium mesophilum DSM 19309]
MPDALRLAADLIRCPTVTPEEGGALVLLESVLAEAGFDCVRVDRNGTPNLYARAGAQGAARSFGFNGHTDVVPPGDPAHWTCDPFGGEVRDGQLWGRGAADMKSGVAAFVAAAVEMAPRLPSDGAICLAITGDEEGASTDGTVALLDWMRERGEAMSVCLVGEPTSVEHLGDTMKIGRRGSLNAYLTVTGVQGHSAYPERAKNPIPALARLVDRLSSHRLDEGTAHFGPSTLAVVTMDTGNPATNVIPAQTRATLNIRFNDTHTGASLSDWLREEGERVAQEFGVQVEISVRISGEAFLTPPGALSDLVSRAVEAETGRRPEASTSGGTSDARFVKDHCPVVELGLVGTTMHKVDERVEAAQVEGLARIYARILEDYFA